MKYWSMTWLNCWSQKDIYNFFKVELGIESKLKTTKNESIAWRRIYLVGFATEHCFMGVYLCAPVPDR